MKLKKEISEKVKNTLKEHDSADSSTFHQSMILCQTIRDLNAVETFVGFYNENITDEREKCYSFTGETSNTILNNFKNLKFKTLVVCGCLLEGFDHSNISVVGIARNVQSPIIFSQFVGRSFRKINEKDPVKACIISDKCFKQKIMWEKFETVPETEISDNEDDESFLTVDDEVEYLLHAVNNK